MTTQEILKAACINFAKNVMKITKGKLSENF